MPRLTSILLLCAALLAPAAVAAAEATVHGVQLPAWVERDGRLIALRPGFQLAPGDVVHTGTGGRVHVELPEGSEAKLGEHAALGLPVMRMTARPDGDVWESTLRVIEGAFRFTTRLSAKLRHRDVRVQVGVATIGVRGTDLLVRADASGDEIMLIEGEVSVAMPGHDTMMMDQPMGMVMVHRDGSMEHPAMSADAMHGMMASTEMEHGGGMLMMDMPAGWDVVVMSLLDPRIAARVAARLEAQGYPTEIEDATVDGRAFHRVSVRGFPDRTEARGFAARIEGTDGITGAWIKRH